jgi:hypothetical protein
MNIVEELSDESSGKRQIVTTGVTYYTFVISTLVCSIYKSFPLFTKTEIYLNFPDDICVMGDLEGTQIFKKCRGLKY